MKNAFLKNKNLKIKIQLTFSWRWPPSWIIILPWLNAGSCHRLPKLYHFLAVSDKTTTSKNAQRKRNTQRQISTASTTAQHPLLLGPLHYQELPDAIKWLKKIITRNVSRLFLLTEDTTTDTTQWLRIFYTLFNLMNWKPFSLYKIGMGSWLLTLLWIISIKLFDNKTLFTWSGGPRSSVVGFFCFVSPRAWKQNPTRPGFLHSM